MNMILLAGELYKNMTTADISSYYDISSYVSSSIRQVVILARMCGYVLLIIIFVHT